MDGGVIELDFRAKLDKLDNDMAGARSKVARAADDMGDDVNHRFGKKLGGIGTMIGKSLAVGLAGAAVGVGAFFKSTFDAAEESRKVGAQTAAVIASTGGVANVSAAQVGNYADKLAALTGIDDELIASGQNLLLTFTNVRNEVGKGNDIFDQGTKAALNMSVALGTDMKSASMLVGKALNDPIAGMTALTRSGIQFTTQQKDQVKAMVAAGDVLGAQKIILKELETQFGGSAEAAASPMARLKVVVGNLQEELGARFLPVVGKVAGFLADKLPGALDRVGQGLSLLKSGFAEGNVSESSGFMGFLVGVGVAARELYDRFREYWPQIRDTVLGAVTAIVGWVQANWPRIQEIISETMATVAAVVTGAVDVVRTIWENFGSQIMSVVSSAWEFVSRTIAAALEVIQGIVKVVTGLIHGDWSQVWEGIKSIVHGAWEAIMALVQVAIDIVRNIVSVGMEILTSVLRGAWDGIVDFVSSIPGRLLDALGDLGSLLVEAGKAIMRGLLDGIKAGLGAVKDFVGGIAGKIVSWKGPLDYDKTILEPAGHAIMGGLVTGLADHEAKLVRQLAHITGLIHLGEGSLRVGMSVPDTGDLLAEAGLLGEDADLGSVGHWNGGGDSGGGGGVTYIVHGSLVSERELRDIGRRGTASATRYNGTPGY